MPRSMSCACANHIQGIKKIKNKGHDACMSKNLVATVMLETISHGQNKYQWSK